MCMEYQYGVWGNGVWSMGYGVTRMNKPGQEQLRTAVSPFRNCRDTNWVLFTSSAAVDEIITDTTDTANTIVAQAAMRPKYLPTMNPPTTRLSLSLTLYLLHTRQKLCKQLYTTINCWRYVEC